MMCFRKIPAAKNYGYKKGCQDFPSNFFLSHNAGNFGKVTLLCCVSEKFRYRKRLCIKGVGYQDFPSKGCLSQSAESFVGENFYSVFQKVSSSEKLYG